MTIIVHIASWGVASVLTKGGKKPKAISVAHVVSAVIDDCSADDAPIAARVSDAGPHHQSVIREFGRRMLRPVIIRGRHVREGDLRVPVPPGGIFDVPPSPNEIVPLDGVICRRIISTGEDEATVKIARLVAPYVLVDGILYRDISPPVWTVVVDCGSVPTKISLTMGDFVPPRNGHALRFPLSGKLAAHEAANRLYRDMGTAELVLPPLMSNDIEIERKLIFSEGADPLLMEDIRREIIGIGMSPSIATLPQSAMENWIAIRRIAERGAAIDETLAGLTRLSASLVPSGAPKNTGTGPFGRDIAMLAGLLAIRVSVDAPDGRREMSDV